MRRYRVDIFDRQFNFISMAQTSEPTLVTDYLVQSNSTFTVPKKLTVSKGNYAQIRDESGSMFQGIVTDYAYDGHTTTVTLAQMSKLLDVDVFADVSTLPNGIEAWFTAQLQSVYNGSDAMQNLMGLNITSSTTTAGVYPVSSDGVYNLYDMAVFLFKVYGVIIDISFSIPAKSVTFAFRVLNQTSVWKIETKLADVADWSVSSPSMNEYPNKMVIRNQEDTTQELTYYWHPTDFAGTVDTNSTSNRVLPVVSRCAVVTPDEGKTFAEAAHEEAYNTMYQSHYDDQIELTFNSGSKLVEVGKIGQLYTVIDGDKQYHTVLTGYQRINDKYTRMTFGYVRTRLTQILREERRKK